MLLTPTIRSAACLIGNNWQTLLLIMANRNLSMAIGVRYSACPKVYENDQKRDGSLVEDFLLYINRFSFEVS